MKLLFLQPLSTLFPLICLVQLHLSQNTSHRLIIPTPTPYDRPLRHPMLR
ncbi:hypothetical protein HanRHA438_Chr17g0820991 [Helianthus annuus]|uniref:Uncharacterized protein n=1 Tax=Helianthus annuus TaxID=4232 RepID=A0A9K3DK16_HELAN|nr:hypothetical protein HanXRQr2_Chr17g0810911 [Helianthus annuus]KAJ0429676.1 hypothetical protein HanHA300_Chr17g0660151 [Helianthus annuus]KAJ0448117.1 hypothetical protein HanHA89_Chr17g0713111 [Helianthus annuus]KAJ0633001.1 hypothetical protein HanLR1_Chr17g0671591 [Helianthus annuus]KAJ0636805.1 hypothetical protein HanOQP8_Chr17g0666291 [Helianthus annuus]